jgi:hypothetical protein
MVNGFKPHRNEDWIKCELYRRLTDLGFSCYPETIFTLENSRQRTRRNRDVRLRADLAVCRGETLICLIEIKHRPKTDKPIKKGRQYERYRELGLPFIYCMNEGQIEPTIERLVGFSLNKQPLDL